jgi:predicted lactoylglutathione lyase
MIDHFNLPVSDIRESKLFYEGVLAALGYSFLLADGDAIGFGKECWNFGITLTTAPINALHVAFTAGNRNAVDDFYRRALELGAQDNGAPGLRSQYDPNYYAAFVIDRDGHNVEAVCRGMSA